MVETLVIAAAAIVLFLWLKRTVARSRQRRLNELLAPILRRARDLESPPVEGVEFSSLPQRDPVYDDLAGFFETPGRVPAELRNSNYGDLEEAVAVWKEAAVRMNSRFALWSRENELRAEGRREPRPRFAVEAILNRMRELAYKVDRQRDWQRKSEGHKAYFDQLLEKLDSSDEWTRSALSALDGVRMSRDDRATASRVRAWMAGGFSVLAARKVEGSLGPLLLGDNASYVGDWLGEAGDVNAINDAGFDVLVRGRKLQIAGETWDAVVRAQTGHYVARLGKMASPV